MVCGDGIGDVLQQHRLAGTRWSDDQAALSFAHWSQQIHDTCADVLTNALLLDALLRVEWSEIVEQYLVARFIGRFEVHRFDLHQRKIFFALMRRTHLATDSVTCLQIELANL